MENNANVEMTGAENQENLNAENVNTAIAEQTTEEPTQTTTEEIQPTPAEIAASYLKEQGFEFESLDDLKKKPEPIEVNPYEDVLDDDDRNYLKFKKENKGLSRKDYESINQDLTKIPRIELARERVRTETGLDLNDEEVDEYISDTLGIDVDDLDNMSTVDKVKLASYTKSVLDAKIATQQKYKTTTNDATAPKAEAEPNNEYIKFDNGTVMKKADYEAHQNILQKHIEQGKEAVNSVTESQFKVTFDDNGTPKEVNYGYEFSDEDRRSMVSMVSDIDSEMNKRYRSEKGFDHKGFAEDMSWSNRSFREKAIASILHKAIAQNTEQVLAERGNFNFNQDYSKGLPSGLSGKTKTVSMADAIRGLV